MVIVLLQSFMASGRAQADFQPMPLPQLRLSVEDQCRLRDRSTIMARQMYAPQGSQYADAQVRLQDKGKFALCSQLCYFTW